MLAVLLVGLSSGAPAPAMAQQPATQECTLSVEEAWLDDMVASAHASGACDAATIDLVVRNGLILPKAILDAPRLGAWNGHASLLPRWRGAAPIQRAIMAGDTQTGAMIMKMDEGLDTGPVALSQTVAITPSMTAGELHDRLAEVTAQLMVEAMARLETEGLPVTPQADDGVTYAAKIDKTETRVDFTKSAQQLHDHVRGLAPSPGAWFELAAGGRPERVKLLTTGLADIHMHRAVPGTALDDGLTIACGEGAIRLLTLQKAGGKPLSAADFLRGTPVPQGTVIG